MQDIEIDVSEYDFAKQQCLALVLPSKTIKSTRRELDICQQMDGILGANSAMTKQMTRVEVERLYSNDVDWRELCKQATEEKDPRRLMEIIRQLNDALDRRQKTRQGGRSQNSSDCCAGQ
jgi:hypothetical protein